MWVGERKLRVGGLVLTLRKPWYATLFQENRPANENKTINIIISRKRAVSSMSGMSGPTRAVPTDKPVGLRQVADDPHCLSPKLLSSLLYPG